MHASPSGGMSCLPASAPLLEDSTVTVGGLLHTFSCFVVERGLYSTTAPSREAD